MMDTRPVTRSRLSFGRSCENARCESGSAMIASTAVNRNRLSFGHSYERLSLRGVGGSINNLFSVLVLGAILRHNFRHRYGSFVLRGADMNIRNLFNVYARCESASTMAAAITVPVDRHVVHHGYGAWTICVPR